MTAPPQRREPAERKADQVQYARLVGYRAWTDHMSFEEAKERIRRDSITRSAFSTSKSDVDFRKSVLRANALNSRGSADDGD